MSVTTLAERRAQIAERSEARSLSMLARLRKAAAELTALDELLDLDRPRLAAAVDGEEEHTDPGVLP